jgi:hypothetical protein
LGRFWRRRSQNQAAPVKYLTLETRRAVSDGYCGTDVFEDINPVELGHHEVQNHEIRVYSRQHLQGGQPIFRDFNLEPFAQKSGAVNVNNHRVVLNEENRLHIVIHSKTAAFLPPFNPKICLTIYWSQSQPPVGALPCRGSPAAAGLQ